MRALLAEYIAVQSSLDEDTRLTHISTALRFPPTPISRTETDNRERIAFRLDPGVAERAAEFALRLPGQPIRRGPAHYSPRPLTDALAVAIAAAHPYTDCGLHGLPQLITHSAAIGLWRLAVAATLTNAEARVLLITPASDLATVLNDGDVAWHAAWRFEVALHLARKLLVGPQQSANLLMITQQHEDFETQRHEIARTEWADSPLLRDCIARPRFDHEGQGGAAVWRAERKLTETKIAQWLVNSSSRISLETPQPGWKLVRPHGWTAVPFVYGQGMTSKQRADVDEGRVLRITAGSRSAIWPYSIDGDPIARFDLVLAATPRLVPASVVELVLLRTEEISDPWVSAGLAVEWGLLTPTEQHHLEAKATENRQRVVESGMRGHWRDLKKVHAELARHVDEPERFARVAGQQGVQGGPFRAGCTWPVESIAAVLASDATDEQVTWLVSSFERRRAWRLEEAMRHASREAYWFGRPNPDDIV
ncbi:hypothetical protein [Pengzhenrongella sicca]|uniref:Uncharacterized protein n=1 Tax=Pengzhenrongella sicca TaxID=2819238 RepID=A0A8A4ZH86_9MICO|nr:hypothetical protein [Pengzhenrongella sicca]QTE30323.1 hypothetical protein J4E96_04805 [Pengzhenrongella sicca]